jgi:formylglycine-generating enzyme required for sulfatase activity
MQPQPYRPASPAKTGRNDLRLQRRVILSGVAAGVLFAGLGWRWWSAEEIEQMHLDNDETPVSIGIAAPAAGCEVYNRGKLRSTCPAGTFWLPAGKYFVRAAHPNGAAYYPVPVLGYRSGPDRDGALILTIRPWPAEAPNDDFVYIPSGHFLIGDRANPREPHYVWLPAYFIAAFEVRNSEYRTFLASGYSRNEYWTAGGLRWRSANQTEASAALPPTDPEYHRFGLDDQPVTGVTWFESVAYCRWLTREYGGGVWTFMLPSDAEWEKAARGPDSFDYGLGDTISDSEKPLYNWGKNPGATITVVGFEETRRRYKPNRYGLYHASGNVAEWTSSAFWPYSKQQPYTEEKRNNPDLPDRRSIRGGSWYSATSAPLYLPYRDGFQPARNGNDMGFRVVARPKP